MSANAPKAQGLRHPDHVEVTLDLASSVDGHGSLWRDKRRRTHRAVPQFHSIPCFGRPARRPAAHSPPAAEAWRPKDLFRTPAALRLQDGADSVLQISSTHAFLDAPDPHL
jgi:hypothetical protein